MAVAFVRERRFRPSYHSILEINIIPRPLMRINSIVLVEN